MAFFDKLKAGLAKTRDAFLGQIDNLFKSFVRIDEDLFDELEETLISADVGVGTTEYILDRLRERVKDGRLKDPADVKAALREILRSLVGEGEEMHLSTVPSAVLVIGVNGVGKTTTIGKIASHYGKEGKRVVVAAADTFRAAAIEQLSVWCDRAGAEMIAQKSGSDPAAVVYDAAAAAKSRGADLLIVDTAGRLQNKKNLMDELSKIDRVLTRELPDADRETLLVLDATTGQNALSQAKEFASAAGVTGLVLTKLDGTAKGGMIFSIARELSIPVKFIGVGEKTDDMRPFNAEEFISALFD